MSASRRASVARRVAVTLIATVAFVLQSLLAAPAGAYRLPDLATCVQPDGTAQDKPAGDHEGGHDHCCILACVACGVAFVASIAGIVHFPERPGSRIVLSRAAAIPVSSPLEFYFGARGPPTDL